MWKTFGSHSVYLDVDTSEAGFSSTPHYVVTMNGMHSHWSVVGGHAIYEPTATSFRIYLLYEVSEVTAKQAQQYDWRVNWIGSTGQSGRSLPCAICAADASSASQSHMLEQAPTNGMTSF